MTGEIFYKNGEPHFVWPHRYVGGNSTRCGWCRYFVEDRKSKDPRLKTGECRSKAAEADRTHIFTRNTADIHCCRWWFPIEKQKGEQEALFNGNA